MATTFVGASASVHLEKVGLGRVCVRQTRSTSQSHRPAGRRLPHSGQVKTMTNRQSDKVRMASTSLIWDHSRLMVCQPLACARSRACLCGEVMRGEKGSNVIPALKLCHQISDVVAMRISLLPVCAASTDRLRGRRRKPQMKYCSGAAGGHDFKRGVKRILSLHTQVEAARSDC